MRCNCVCSLACVLVYLFAAWQFVCSVTRFIVPGQAAANCTCWLCDNRLLPLPLPRSVRLLPKTNFRTEGAWQPRNCLPNNGAHVLRRQTNLSRQFATNSRVLRCHNCTNVSPEHRTLLIRSVAPASIHSGAPLDVLQVTVSGRVMSVSCLIAGGVRLFWYADCRMDWRMVKASCRFIEEGWRFKLVWD